MTKLATSSPANTRVYFKEELAPLNRKSQVSWLGEAKGYGLVASETFAVGDVIVDREAPLVATLNPGPSTRCVCCWKELASFEVRCGCGVHYCSQECKRRHAAPHSYICTAKIESMDHPLIAFKLHAVSTNPAFLTAAWGVAQVLAAPSEMTRRLANLHLMRWEETVPAPEEEDDFEETLKNLAAQAQTQLESGLLALDGAEPRAVKTACEAYFNPLLGALERNQFEIQIDSPEDENNDEQHPCGAGLFTLCCAMNHSCEPNAEISFESGTNEATVKTLRSISPGEEICISYVEEDGPLETRRDALRDYGFVCVCPRCEQEEVWIAEQQELALRVIFDRCDVPDFTPRRIAGFDISFPENETDPCVACLAVLSFPDMKLMFEVVEDCVLTQPYISGFLAFREAGVCQKLLEGVPEEFRPDVLVLDGSGVMHPRGCGLASHVGVVCDLPTIGVSKKLLAVDGLTRDGVRQKVRASSKRELDMVGDSGRVWGRAYLPPRAMSNPVFVSVGHRLDLDTAMSLVKACCVETRVPAPVRLADLRSRDELRQRKRKKLGGH